MRMLRSFFCVDTFSNHYEDALVEHHPLQFTDEGGHSMNSIYAEARETIELRLTLNVILGQLDETLARVWCDAFRCLNDGDIAQLMMLTRGLDDHRASSVTLRFLMQHCYPFREMVLYQTDDAFKRRMGLDGTDPHTHN